jgi:hypothetical protein
MGVAMPMAMAVPVIGVAVVVPMIVHGGRNSIGWRRYAIALP